MRFQAYFAPVIKVLLYIMAVISIIGLTIGILALAGVRIELTTPQATLLVSVCPFVRWVYRYFRRKSRVKQNIEYCIR